jgi:hypothetical protein
MPHDMSERGPRSARMARRAADAVGEVGSREPPVVARRRANDERRRAERAAALAELVVALEPYSLDLIFEALAVRMRGDWGHQNFTVCLTEGHFRELYRSYGPMDPEQLAWVMREVERSRREGTPSPWDFEFLTQSRPSS